MLIRWKWMSHRRNLVGEKVAPTDYTSLTFYQQQKSVFHCSWKVWSKCWITHLAFLFILEKSRRKYLKKKTHSDWMKQLKSGADHLCFCLFSLRFLSFFFSSFLVCFGRYNYHRQNKWREINETKNDSETFLCDIQWFFSFFHFIISIHFFSHMFAVAKYYNKLKYYYGIVEILVMKMKTVKRKALKPIQWAHLTHTHAYDLYHIQTFLFFFIFYFVNCLRKENTQIFRTHKVIMNIVKGIFTVN